MDKREKVIRGLECCAREDIGDCVNCPYESINGPHCDIEMMRDAIALLKAQEPRVMTSSEVMDYVGYFEKNPPSEATKLPLWTESKKETGVFSGYRNVGNIRNLIHTSGLDRSYIFNQHWRCWTSRPDDETREATPWE